jgi:hypothetical protein
MGLMKWKKGAFARLPLAMLAIFIAVLSLAAAPAPSAADDEPEPEVVQIGTAEDLLNFADRVNAGEADLDAELTADIVVEDSWVSPIGQTTNGGKGYGGTFDGKGHSVSLVRKYLLDSSTLNPAGGPNQTAMFSRINGLDQPTNGLKKGTVKNLAVNVDFSTFPLTSGAYNTIAGVALQNYGRIERVAVNGSITHTAPTGSVYVGGIASYTATRVPRSSIASITRTSPSPA